MKISQPAPASFRIDPAVTNKIPSAVAEDTVTGVPEFDKLLKSPGAARVRIGELSFNQAMEGVARFKFDGAGSIGTRDIVPQGKAAKEMLSGKHGAALEQALRGVLENLDDRGQRVELDGFAFAKDKPAAIASEVLQMADLHVKEGGNVSAAKARDWIREVESLPVESFLGTYFPTKWLALGIEPSQNFIERVEAGPTADAKRGEALATIQHELEHAITPSFNSSAQHLFGLEEAMAELLTQWNGSLEKLGEKTGIRESRTGAVSYDDLVTKLEGFMTRAGFDKADANQLDAVRDILQGAQLEDTPNRIAEAVVAREGRGTVSEVSEEIVDAFAA